MTHARPLVVVFPAFLTRQAIFFAATSATDSIVYHQYRVAAASVAEDLFRQHDTEYPQLAVAFSGRRRLAGRPASRWRGAADQCPQEQAPRPRHGAVTEVGIGLVLFMVDLAALASLLCSAEKATARANVAARSLRRDHGGPRPHPV